jgi:Pyridoxamine 5'-phosphate oxidase
MTATPVFALTPQIKALVTGALDSGNALLLAAVDKDRKPLLSFRGSTAVYSDTQLSFWARNAEGGTLEAIKQNPQVAFMYRSQTVPMLQFGGRARITDIPAERNRVFEIAHEREQKSDPERKGRAVIVDLDTVKGVLGIGKDGPIFCHLSR